MATKKTKKATEYLHLKQGKKHIGGSSWVGIAFDVGLDVVTGTKSGQSFGESVIKGAGNTVAWAVAPGVMWTVFGAGLAGGMAKGIYNLNENLDSRYYENMKNAQPNFQYTDTRQAMTMRQASVQAIQGSKMNARNALGGEASLMHRTQRTF